MTDLTIPRMMMMIVTVYCRNSYNLATGAPRAAGSGIERIVKL